MVEELDKAMSNNSRKKRILHVVVGDEDWIPSQKQLDEVEDLFNKAIKDPTNAVIATRKGIKVHEITDYDEVKAHSIKQKFESTDAKRVSNNPVLSIEDYNGPDDVALRYHTLSDEEKAAMLRVKLAAQYLINTLRDLGNHRDLALAIEHAQDASMRGVRYITQSSKQ